MDYPGLADAVAVYGELKAAVAGSKSAVEAYITAVNAIATKTTFAEMKAAVEAAGKEVEGGSAYPLVVNSEAAKLTEERVCKLYELLK